MKIEIFVTTLAVSNLLRYNTDSFLTVLERKHAESDLKSCFFPLLSFHCFVNSSRYVTSKHPMKETKQQLLSGV